MSQSQQGTFSVFRGCNSSNNNSSIHTQDYNEVVYFDGGSTDYLDLIYNSRIRETLYLSIETLTNDSKKSRIVLNNEKLLLGKKKGTFKTPRPHNEWIIYRRDKQALLSALNLPFGGNKSTVSSSASVKISEMWKNESDEVREYYMALSRLALDNHTKKYGKGYKYQPIPKSKTSRRLKKQKRSAQHKEDISQIPTPVTSSPEPEMLVITPSPSSSSKDFSNNNISTLIINANIDFFEYDFEVSPPQLSIPSPPSPPTINEYPTPATTTSSLESLDYENFLAFPNYSDITNESPLAASEESLFENFFMNASILAAHSSEFATNTTYADFPGEPLIDPLLTESTTSQQPEYTQIQCMINGDSPLYDSEWQINDEKPYQDQMDFSHYNNVYSAL